MSLSFVRGAAAAVLVVLIPRLAAAGAPDPASITPRPPAPQLRLAASHAALSPIEAAALALPDARAALAEELARRGVPDADRDALLPVLAEELRGVATQGGSEPTLAVGPCELTAAQLREVVGPREARSRFEVVRRLRLAAPGACAGLDADELLALVPPLVRADDALRSRDLLERLGRALFEMEDSQ